MTASVSRRPTLAAWLLAALLGLSAGDARALCVLVCGCAVSTSNLVFGAINPLSTSNTDSTGSVMVACGGLAGLLIPVTVDIGKGTGASFANRTMTSGTNAMFYNLYTDPAHTQVFGDGTSGTSDMSTSISLNLLGLGPTSTIYVYGRVPGGQLTTPPGSYGDAIAVTMTYY